MYYNMFLMLICIAIFILYIYLDYHRYDYIVDQKVKEPFILEGHPANDRYAPIPYSIIAKGIQNPKLMEDDDKEKKALMNAITNKYSIIINNPANEKVYNLSKIEEDLKYFNNATNLLDMNAHNDLGQLNLF
jgi:hypothetical protein